MVGKALSGPRGSQHPSCLGSLSAPGMICAVAICAQPSSRVSKDMQIPGKRSEGILAASRTGWVHQHGSLSLWLFAWSSLPL